MPETERTVAEAVADALVRHGVEIVFGQSNPTALMLAAERRGIRQVLYRTENAGGVMADGYARISHKIGVLALQNGPAATLAVAPMAEAMKASVPLLVIVQEVPVANRDRNAFQELDHTALFSEVSRWTRRLDDPARVDDYVDMAMVAATTGRPGPVVLLLPRDVLDQPTGSAPMPRVAGLGTFPLDRQRPDAARVAQAARLIAEADAPLVMAGGGVHLSGATDALTRLVETAHLPVATTNMGKGAVAETGPYALGVAANLTGRNGPTSRSLELLEDADVVLLVGTRTNENGTDKWGLTRRDATYIHVDADGLEVGRNYESVRLVGDARAALEDLTDALTQLDLSRRTAGAEALTRRIAEGRERRGRDIAAAVTAATTPIAPERLVTELDRLLTAEDIVASDASYSGIWSSAYLTARAAGQRFLTPRGLAGLGWGAPLAMGARLARPSSRVVAIVGDGGFAHVWSELETAVRERIPVVVVVLNNAQLGYQRHAENRLFDGTTTAIEFAPVDHAAVARAVGAVGVRLTDPARIQDVLAEALASPVPVVIDAIVDPDAYGPTRLFDGHDATINRPAAPKGVLVG
ncbi:acetolactate synthase catalytic subunit [Nocardioides sp. QY071]|uniref:acetolactate synthase catalytic subunit n=1 Tax=Nocardioides sp. QY071 TaxID=3044187 RepID=UPI00249CCA07|nr:acetolactate synthase catalytic subunit [Nocardioides sp. QY071]WGY00349.1 acetolactate synthase catalytic subunit [Nocardioides sp. QY071]